MIYRTLFKAVVLSGFFSVQVWAQDSGSNITLGQARGLLVGSWEFHFSATHERNSELHPNLHKSFDGMIWSFDAQQCRIRMGGQSFAPQPWSLEAGADANHFALRRLVDQKSNNETIEVLQIHDKNTIVLKTGDGYELALKRLAPQGFPQGYFRLTTRAAEHQNLVLESDPLTLQIQTNVTGIDWKAVPIGDGYFYLTTRHLEEQRRVLEGQDGTQPAQMAPAANATGMAWKAIPVGNGYYHLTNRFMEQQGKVLFVDGHDAEAGNSTTLDAMPYMVDADAAGPGVEWKFLHAGQVTTPKAAQPLLLGQWESNLAETVSRHGELDSELFAPFAAVTMEFREREFTVRVNATQIAKMQYSLNQTEFGGLELATLDADGEEQREAIRILSKDRIIIRPSGDIPSIVFDRIYGATIEETFHLEVPGTNKCMACYTDEMSEPPEGGVDVFLSQPAVPSISMTKLKVRPMEFTSPGGVNYVAYRVENNVGDSTGTYWLSMGADRQLRIEAGPKDNPFGEYAFWSFEHRSIGHVHDVHAIAQVWTSDPDEGGLNHPDHFYFLTVGNEGSIVAKDFGSFRAAEGSESSAWRMVPVKY